MAPKVKKAGGEENVSLGPATREGELVFESSPYAAMLAAQDVAVRCKV